jgi:hypothetical protein
MSFLANKPIDTSFIYYGIVVFDISFKTLKPSMFAGREFQGF